MKKTKVLITIVLLMFCFILNSELYQGFLENFDADYYYVQITVNGEKCSTFTERLTNISERFNKPFFYIDRSTTLLGHSEINIYCTNSAHKELNNIGIKDGLYKAALSGESTVNFHELKDLNVKDGTYKILFSAQNYEFEGIYKQINRNFVSGYIHQDNNNHNKEFSVLLWLTFCIFYLLFAFLEVQFKKKELFIKISLGDLKTKTALAEVLKDDLLFVLAFVLIKSILSQIFYTGFNMPVIILVAIFCLASNLFVYLFVFKVNYKEILYGGNIGEVTVANCYVVKVTSMVLTILLICMNTAIIISNIAPLINSKHIKKYYNNYFITIQNEQPDRSADSVVKIPNMYNKTAVEGYKNTKAKISVKASFVGEDGRPFVFTNDILLLIDSGIKGYKNNGENIIILPYDIGNEKEPEEVFIQCAKSLIKTNTGISADKINCEVLYAEKTSKAIYFDLNDKTNAQLGYAMAKNPVFVYCNTDKLDFSLSEESIPSSKQTDHVLYEPDFLKNNSDLLNQYEFSIQQISAEKIFTENKAALTKTVLLSLIIVFLQVLIDISLISSLIKVEYSANAAELSIKKILGYSVFSKNKSLIFLNIYSSLIGILTSVIVFYLLLIHLKLIAIIIGLLVMLLEIGILILKIGTFERVNVVKMIKGGAL